jgi:hypothetical protein
VANAVVSIGVEPVSEPRPCVKTGVLTSDVLLKTASRTPGWIWLLLLFGVWPYLIAAHFTRRSVKVAVPFCNEAWDRYMNQWKVARNVMVGSAVLTILFLAIFRARPYWVGLVGLGCFLIALGMAIVNELENMCGASLGPDFETVSLTRVHPTFAAEEGRRLAVSVHV